MAGSTKGRAARAATPQKAKREAPSRRRERERLASQPRLPLGRRNWMVIGAGLVAILAGFFALSRGSITLAPFLLVAGYCVLIPVGILLPAEKSASGGAAVTGSGE